MWFQVDVTRNGSLAWQISFGRCSGDGGAWHVQREGQDKPLAQGRKQLKQLLDTHRDGLGCSYLRHKVGIEACVIHTMPYLCVILQQWANNLPNPMAFHSSHVMRLKHDSPLFFRLIIPFTLFATPSDDLFDKLRVWLSVIYLSLLFCPSFYRSCSCPFPSPLSCLVNTLSLVCSKHVSFTLFCLIFATCIISVRLQKNKETCGQHLCIKDEQKKIKSV